MTGARNSFRPSSSTTNHLKLKFLIPPAVALLIVGGWIGTQRHSISTLDKESALFRNHLAAARASAGSDVSSPVKIPGANSAKDKKPVDWKQVAAQMEEMQRNNGIGDMRAMIHLQQRLQSMTKEELVAAMDEIAKLDLPAGAREELEQMLIGPLVEKDPELALKSFAARLQGLSDRMSLQLSNALGKWAENDPGKAAAWLDGQIAAGNFDSKTLDGKSQSRILFEGEMIRILVGSDLAAAEARLANLPEDQWKGIFQGPGANGVKEQDQKAFADLARGRLAEKETNNAIAMIAANVLVPKGYPEASAYLDRISATPEERAMSANTAAKIQMMQDAHKGIISRERIDKLREWVTTQSPSSADATIGQALAGGSGSFNGKFKFADAAVLALQYHESSGNDDVLFNFLGGGQARQNKEQAIKLAEKISDPVRREEILKKLN